MPLYEKERALDLILIGGDLEKDAQNIFLINQQKNKIMYKLMR